MNFQSDWHDLILCQKRKKRKKEKMGRERKKNRMSLSLTAKQSVFWRELFWRSPTSRGKSWKINAGPGKSWKSLNSCKKVFLKRIVCNSIFGLLFRKGYCFNYCAFGRPGKYYLSPGEVVETPGRLFL